MLTREAVEPVYTLKLSGVQKLELKLNGTLKCKTKKKKCYQRLGYKHTQLGRGYFRDD